jgi:nucleoid-associated protein YgaU
MTSDAKIGLLLGLVFIFIIAFIINGLPNFRNEANSNELTTNMVSLEDRSLGIATRERKAEESLSWEELLEKSALDLNDRRPTGEKSEGIRSVLALPGADLTNNDTMETAHKTDTVSSLSTASQIYVVKEGDNLAAIAQKCYGSVEGNKRINVSRIFQANRDQLRSADEVYVGQKLLIPSLSTLMSDRDDTADAISDTVFEKVKSVGRRHLSTHETRTNQDRWYTVREGDSLWKIAANQLGSGTRYTEISKLNIDILDDEDNLAVGMRLRMPIQ